MGILTATHTSTELKFGFENGPEYFVLDDVSIDPYRSQTL
jgi:hypothetical protein